MKAYFKILIFLLIIFSGCTSEKKNLLKDNNTFTVKETAQLNSFLEDFDNTIAKIQETGSSDIETNYYSFFERLRNQSKDGILNIGIDQESQNRLEARINKDLTDELWSRMYYNNVRSEALQDSCFRNIIHSRGKLFQFLETEVAPDYPVIHADVEKLRIAGETSPPLIATILFHYENYNIQDDRVRLFIALHYMGLNRDNLNEQKH